MESHVLAFLLCLPLLAAGSRGYCAAGFWDGPPVRDEATACERAEAIVASMSAEEILGQTLMFGYLGTDPSPKIVRWIAERKIGGVKLFSRNVKDLADLARGIVRMQGLGRQGKPAVPLFVATDQEGGWVRQIKEETSVSPGNLALGASGAPADAYLTGYYLGRELASLGINMNFAPDVDVYSNPDASVIGPRSFGSDPAQAGLLAAAYARGMAKAGVICTAKHFPGHGSADQDSHGHLPSIEASLETLRGRDLVPYRILIKEDIPAVMSAHLAFPSILADKTPASLSPFFLRTVLRDELGFRGIVITDDMEMEGVLSGGLSTPEACRRALEAGNDVVLVSHTPDTQERTWSLLRQAMRSSPAFASTLRASARRVVEAKLRFFRQDSAVPAGGSGPETATGGAASPRATVPAAPSISTGALPIPAPGAGDFFFQSSCRSVTKVADKRLPYRPTAGERILICGQFEEFLEEGKLRYPKADTLPFAFTPFYQSLPSDRTRVAARAQGYDTVIFCLANFNSLEVLQTMKAMAGKLIVVSALTPVYLRETPWVETAIAVYGSGRDSFRAAFAALEGDFSPAAAMPVRFERGKE